jgi:hypothetical protein
MDQRLTDARAAQSSADVEVLGALADEANGQTAGLLAAISHAADWEFHRRGGIDFEMLPLGEAIDEGDLDAALGLSVTYRALNADRFQASMGDLAVERRHHETNQRWAHIASSCDRLRTTRSRRPWRSNPALEIE